MKFVLFDFLFWKLKCFFINNSFYFIYLSAKLTNLVRKLTVRSAVIWFFWLDHLFLFRNWDLNSFNCFLYKAFGRFFVIIFPFRAKFYGTYMGIYRSFTLFLLINIICSKYFGPIIFIKLWFKTKSLWIILSQFCWHSLRILRGSSTWNISATLRIPKPRPCIFKPIRLIYDRLKRTFLHYLKLIYIFDLFHLLDLVILDINQLNLVKVVPL